MSKQKKVLTGCVLIALIVLAVIAGIWFGKNQTGEEPIDETEETTESDRYITYEGKKYEYNYNLKNILFLGVDKSDVMTEHDAGRGGQSDTLILLSMNKEDKTTTLLEISRDTMTDVKIYDINGKYLDTERAQITLQYAYGDGRKKSCRLTQEAVSNLLYDIPISAYMALGVEGISVITDLMGGVELTVPEDYTYIDPAFKKGDTIVLSGAQAEKYVRYRDTNETGSNNQRMNRQTEFLQALALQLQGKDIGWYQRLMSGAEDYITTNIDMSEAEKLTQYTMKEPIEIVPGEVRQGNVHDEFVVDDENLVKLVVKLFYKPVD